MTDHEQTLKPGSQLEEFRIERVLGEGGFGITYLAFDTHFQKHVAIKEYYYAPWCFRSEGSTVNSRTNHKDDFKYGLDSFLQEARTIAKFEHPNIVKVIRFFEANGTAYIAMEYIEGQTLGSQIEDFKNKSEEGMFNEEEMLFVLQPIISGLKQLHRTNVYHRDLKPENIMLRKNGSPVLIDFGAAREAMGNKSQNLAMIVTEGYSPLEQYNSTSEQGPWTDIYALAAVAYTCLTGEKPDESTHRALGDKVIPLVEAARGQGSLNFLKAVDNALAIRPADRPQTLEEWWEQLTQSEPIRGKDVYLKQSIEEWEVKQSCHRLITYNGKTVKLLVPANSKSGTQIKLKGKGEPGKDGGENGDLYIEITVDIAKRGSDVYLKESIKNREAKQGCRLFITDRGNKFDIEVPAKFKSGTQLKLKGKGKRGENGGENGDLYVNIEIKTNDHEGDIYRTEYITAELARNGGVIDQLNYKVNIPKNTLDNTFLILKRQGNSGSLGGSNGDLIVKIRICIRLINGVPTYESTSKGGCLLPSLLIFGFIVLLYFWEDYSSSEDTTRRDATNQATSSEITPRETKKTLQEQNVLSHLTIKTDPANARVRILNIVPPYYYDAIELQPGKYHIEVSKLGYEQYKDWLELKVEDTEYIVTLTPIPESPLPNEEELEVTKWPIDHCMLGGWFSKATTSEHDINDCYVPWTLKTGEFAEKHIVSIYGSSSACGDTNSGKYLFRCNPELFGPGPTDYEMQLLNIANARGAEDNAAHKNKGACVSNGGGTFIGITKKCLIFSEKLDALKIRLGEKSWIEAMDSYTFEQFYRNKFFPLRKYIESFCEYYVGAGDKAKNCASMKIQVKKIVNRANELGLY